MRVILRFCYVIVKQSDLYCKLEVSLIFMVFYNSFILYPYFIDTLEEIRDERWGVMEKVKAILFDKDGTLMDFHSIWIKVAEELVAECIKLYQLPQSMQPTLLKEIGVDGVFVHPRSAIAAGTSLDVAKGFVSILRHLKKRKCMNG